MDIAAVASALMAGLLSFFSPCILPLIPIYVGILTSDANAEKLNLGRRVAHTVAFVLGISTMFAILGFGAGALGGLLNNSVLAIILGVVIVFFGLYVAGVIRIPFLENEHRADMSKIQVNGVLGAYLLGLAFSFGWTPCVGPILGSILALAAEQGGALPGAILLLFYSLGMCVPFVVITLASDVLLSKVRNIHKYMPTIKRVGGILIAIMGVWMVVTQAQNLAAKSKTASTAEVLAAQGVSAGEADTSNVSSAWKNVVTVDLEGNKHRLSDLKGKPVYFEFWGSWCTNCVKDMGNLSTLYHEHEQKGDVQVVSVITPNYYGEKSAEDFKVWAQENGVDFPCWLDENASLSQYLNVSGFPTSVFIDSEGNLAKVRVGTIEPEELEQILSELQ